MVLGGVINSYLGGGDSAEFQFQIASLIIPLAKQRDSGNYTCSPSNSDAVTAMLHVIKGRQCILYLLLYLI